MALPGTERSLLTPKGLAKTFATYALALGLLLLIWWGISTFFIPPTFFSPPGRTFSTAWEMLQDGSLPQHVAASMKRIVIGFTLGSLLGALLGLAMGSVRWVRHVMEPHLEFFRHIPSIAFISLVILWFGIGETSKVILIIWTTFFIVLINTLAGITSAPEVSYRAARSLGARPMQVLRRITVPVAIPFVLAGMKLAMVNAFGTIIIAEMMSADEGLGYLIQSSQAFLRTDRVFVGVLTLAVLGFAFDRVFRFTGMRLTKRFGTQL